MFNACICVCECRWVAVPLQVVCFCSMLAAAGRFAGDHHRNGEDYAFAQHAAQYRTAPGYTLASLAAAAAAAAVAAAAALACTRGRKHNTWNQKNRDSHERTPLNQDSSINNSIESNSREMNSGHLIEASQEERVHEHGDDTDITTNTSGEKEREHSE